MVFFTAATGTNNSHALSSRYNKRHTIKNLSFCQVTEDNRLNKLKRRKQQSLEKIDKINIRDDSIPVCSN